MAALFLILLASIFGLIAGSFLNVLIYRGPALWGLIDPEIPRGTIWGPRSQCPHCRHIIKSWHNIPILSYFLLGKKCAYCKHPISFVYPLIEFLGAIAAALAVFTYGWSFAGFFAAIFLLALIALAAIDWQTGYLPDAITFPLIAVGLIANGFGLFTTFTAALIGAVSGYGVFWSIAFFYRHLRHQEGLGLGDAKLLAAIGAWVGWFFLPMVVLVGCLAALSQVGLMALFGTRINPQTPIRFGPALAIAGATIMIAMKLSLT